MAGIYCADIYCDDCIEDIKDRIATELWDDRNNAVTPDGEPVSDFTDCSTLLQYLEGMGESDYDSGDYPKYCGDDEESDCPQHCGSGADCLDPSETSNGEKYGHFFGNYITDYGDKYVKETVNRDLALGHMDSPAVELWMPCYDNIDYHEKCECGAYDDLDENGKCDDCLENNNNGD